MNPTRLSETPFAIVTSTPIFRMQKLKNILFYLGTVGVFSGFMYWLVFYNSHNIESGRNIITHNGGKGHWQEFLDALSHNLSHPLAILLAQIITIIFVARILGLFFKKIGQPTVIGEILAGILLGPSLIGTLYPGFSAALFPAASLGNLQFLSQIGLILFMFVVGMELDLKVLKNKAQEAVVISHASIIFPFALGMGLAYFLYERFAPDTISFSSFGLFMGIAMSITAFPVLARIVQERNLHKTKLGTIVITCAAADDITAWCVLAAVIAIVKAGSFVSSLYIIGLACIYVLIMIKMVRPFLARIGNLYSTRDSLSKPIVAIFFLTLILSAYTTEIIGIHALFGAFMAGAIMPGNMNFRSLFIEKVEDVSLVLLLPLFFVFTGLRTEIGLLNDLELWKITGFIILVAVSGKFIGSALAAKYVGQGWKDSLTIGALMNTRGLMELVVLNIGYDLGVLSPEIFAMMVIMALVTTLMTGPVLDLINFLFKNNPSDLPIETEAHSLYRVLISFGNPERGKTLLKLAHSMVKKATTPYSITAMHLSNTQELLPHNLEEQEKNYFTPLVQESEKLNQKITTLFKPSNDIDSDIVEYAHTSNSDLLLVGIGHSIYEGSLLGKILGFTTRFINPEKILNQVTGKENLFENSPFDDTTQNILLKSKIPVGILLDKDFKSVKKVLLPYFSENEFFLFSFAEKLIQNSDSQVHILDVSGNARNNSQLKEKIQLFNRKNFQALSILEDRVLNKEFLIQFDLMLISVDSWKYLLDSNSLWLSDIPSTLILQNNK